LCEGKGARGCAEGVQDLLSGQVVTPASQDSTAVVEGTSASDVLLLLKTELDMYRKWKTRVANPGEGLALEVAS
jgi:hypothetical protein